MMKTVRLNGYIQQTQDGLYKRREASIAAGSGNLTRTTKTYESTEEAFI